MSWEKWTYGNPGYVLYRMSYYKRIDSGPLNKALDPFQQMSKLAHCCTDTFSLNLLNCY